jgi:hypothetical protein
VVFTILGLITYSFSMKSAQENHDISHRKNKNQPWDVRIPGTKEYSVILSNLMSYKRELTPEEHPQKTAILMLKIAQKIAELGFEEIGENLKKQVGKRKAGKYQEPTAKKKEEALKLATQYWQKANEKSESAKAKVKETEAKQRAEVRAQAREARKRERLQE